MEENVVIIKTRTRCEYIPVRLTASSLKLTVRVFIIIVEIDIVNKVLASMDSRKGRGYLLCQHDIHLKKLIKHKVFLLGFDFVFCGC